MYKEHREIDNKVLIEILETSVERDATADNQNIICQLKRSLTVFFSLFFLLKAA